MTESGYVYRIIAPGSNSVYVGQSVCPAERFKQHKRHPSNHALRNFIAKHPEAEMYFWPVLDMRAEEIADEQLCRRSGFNLLNCTPCGGRPPSHKGMKRSPESSEKSAKARRGAKRTPEQCAKMGWWKGKKHTSEHIANVRASKLGHGTSPETRLKISTALKGRKQTAENIEKNAVAHRGLKQSPEQTQKTAAANRGRKRSPEQCARISAATKGKSKPPWSAERRAAWLLRSLAWVVKPRKPRVFTRKSAYQRAYYLANQERQRERSREYKRLHRKAATEAQWRSG